jgi:hypothetical protein
MPRLLLTKPSLSDDAPGTLFTNIEIKYKIQNTKYKIVNKIGNKAGNR